MISNQEEDEFVAVRVQDPRIQNEGSWNSYVDYKIFLHTNSKAFTAKTSCVRRRYSEFVWLRKKLQKNAGLVPVPDLPGKSFFSFSNEDFLERRRKGLQAFLDKVVHTTVCLSDSQLHLFLQTQLPIGHIQDCVQGHTPYTVTDAILTYASSNQGFVQAQEDDSIKDPSLTVSYESMESPVPRQPCIQTNEAFSPELFSCGDSEPLEVLLELRDQDKPSIRICQKSNHLEAVVEDSGPTDVSFYLGGSLEDTENINPAEQTQQRSCQMQIPVEVHLPMETGSEYNMQEEQIDMDTQEKPDAHHRENGEDEKCMNPVTILDKNNSEGQVTETGCHEVPEDGCSEKEDRISDVNDSLAADVSSDSEKSDESGVKEEAHLQTENHNVNGVLEEEGGEDDTYQVTEVKQEVYLIGTNNESDVDSSHSLPSSNQSIVKVSDEESMCEQMEHMIQAVNGYTDTPPEDNTHWSGIEVSSSNMQDLQINGCAVEKGEDTSALDDEHLQYTTDISVLNKSGDVNSTVADGELTENSDFSILNTSCVPEMANGEYTEEQDALSSLPVKDSEDTQDLVC